MARYCLHCHAKVTLSLCNAEVHAINLMLCIFFCRQWKTKEFTLMLPVSEELTEVEEAVDEDEVTYECSHVTLRYILLTNRMYSFLYSAIFIYLIEILWDRRWLWRRPL